MPTEIKDELKPCPFCGSLLIVTRQTLSAASALLEKDQFVAFCTICAAHGPPGADKIKAAIAWDQRKRQVNPITWDILYKKLTRDKTDD